MVDPVSSSSGAQAPQLVRNPAPKPTLNAGGGSDTVTFVKAVRAASGQNVAAE